MNRHIRSRFWIPAILLLIAAVAGGEGPSPSSYLTNVEMMQIVTRGAVTEGIDRFPAVADGPIFLRSAAGSEIDWIVENELITALSRRGFPVRVVGEAAVGGTGKGRSGTDPGNLSFPVDTPPELVEGDPVAYPEGACAAGAEGKVDLRLIVNEQGSVANVLIDESTGESFESAVKEAVMRYRYRPAEKDGAVVPGMLALRFDFPPLSEGCEEARVSGEPIDPGGTEEGEGPAGGADHSLSSAPGGPSVLSYRVSEIEMRYPRVKRKFWLGPKRVDRYARVRIDLRWKRENDVLWAESVEHYASDRVPFGALRYLENEAYAFAKPELAGGSVGRFVEPLVVAGVIGGLVLLFYANQTGE